jgi:hypothetical protein
MSISYPDLNPEPEVVAPAASAPVDHAYTAAIQAYAQKCGACNNPIGVKGKLDTVLSCGHPMHVDCVTLISSFAKISMAEISGMKHCAHCRDRVAQGFAMAYEEQFDAQTTPEFCLSQLKSAHRTTYPRLNLDESFGNMLSRDYTLKLLGETCSTVEQLQRTAASSRFFGSLLEYVGQAPAAEPEQSQQYGALRGSDFIAECSKRGKTITDILTNDGTIADVWNCGIQTMDELRKIGFSATIHFAFRSVMPIHVLVEKYGASYENDMKDHMTNEQLLACKLTKFDLPLLGLRADALVARRFTQEQLAEFKNIGLGDWIRYGHLHLSHAIRMRMTGAFMMETWRNELIPGTPAHKLYADVCASNGEREKKLKKRSKR